MFQRFCLLPIVLASLTLSLAGCGMPSDEATATGTITVDGQPIEGLEVRFDPQFDGGRQSMGFTDADGRFEAMATRDRVGLKPGTYKVRISGTQYLEGETKVLAKIPPEYGTESTQQVEIAPGENTVDIDVKTK